MKTLQMGGVRLVVDGIGDLFHEKAGKLRRV
jgi:hypothetical protein